MDLSKDNLNNIVNDGENINLEFDDCIVSGLEFEPDKEIQGTIIGIPGGPGVPKEYLIPLVKFIDEEYRVVLFESHNIGESENHDEPYKIETHRKFVDTLVNNYDNVLLAGHSWGSMIIMDYMCNNNDYDVDGLILLAPLFDTQMSIEIAETIRAMILNPNEVRYMYNMEIENDFYEDNKYEELAEEFDNKVGFLPPVPEFAENVFEDFNNKMYEEMWGPEEFILNKDGELFNWSVMNNLSNINSPTLLLTGKHDMFGYHDMYKAANIITGDTTVEVLNGCSHSLLWERPNSTNSVISNWIDDL